MANPKLYGTYDFTKVSLIFGTQEIRGFQEGSEITVERAEDSFTKQVDVDGNVTRSRSNNSTGTITFSLSQFSESNRYLQTIQILDEKTGAGVLPCKLVDKSNPNEEIVIAAEAWLTRPANKTFGAESSGREWVIDCAALVIV